MAGPFRDRKFFIAFPDIFMRQTAFGSLLANSDIDAKHPMLTPTYPTSQITRERTQDCSNEYFISEDLTSRLKRIRIGFNPSAQMAAGWLAFAYGAAASATGTPANEVQTLTVTAGDPYTLSFTFEGLTGTTGLIPIDATAAVVQEQLNALRSIKQGAQNSINAAVTGSAGGPYTITFQNKLAKANLPLLVSSEVTAVVAETTPGENKEHGLTRSTSDQPPQTTLIYGFEGDVTPARKIGNVVVNEIALAVPEARRSYANLILLHLGRSLPERMTFPPVSISRR